MLGKDDVCFYLRPVPEGVWENKVTLRSMDRVSPTPLLMVVA
jgi:hypothetical protein